MLRPLRVLLLLTAALQAALPPPDVTNAAYGPHERNVLDLWKAKADRPTPLVVYIHGGGFIGGDKRSLNSLLLELCLKGGISVAAINYRYSTQAPYPAPMLDGARAIQYLRSRAGEWNLDREKFAATGGSAGAGISLWIGFHEDMIDANSRDPVLRQSTRLSSMAVLGAQTTYDPRAIASLIGEAAARHPALEPFYGLKGDELKTERAYGLFRDASPVSHLTADDPPVLLFYSEPDQPLPADAKPGTGIHHPRFGRFLKERMDKLGIECVVRHATEYGEEPMPKLQREMVAFFQKHFRTRLSHVEQVAPGVWAAGYADRYRSANSGWIARKDHTVLIDLPRGVAVPEFLEEARKATGKPARSVVLTAKPGKDDASVLEELARLGVARQESAAGLEIVAGGAIFLPKEKVLFAGSVAVNGPRARLEGQDTEAWIGKLASLEKLHAATVVPGFGSWGGPPILERQRRFLTELRRQVAYGITMGRPLEAIAREILLPASYYAWMPYDTPAPEDIRHVYGELTAPVTAGGPGPHALVLVGDRYHEPEHLIAGLRPALAATGVTAHFTVDVRALTAEALSHVQLLVILRDGMLWPEGPSKPYRIWMTPEQEKAVVDFVEKGGAFLNLHNSMGLYPADGPYLQLVGGRYIGHGPLERFRVEVVDRDHPITRGVSDYSAADEQHTPPSDPEKVRLLLRNRSDDGKTAAAGWVWEPGRGRLCHLASGHTRDALEHPMFQRLLRNAVNWCLRR